MDCKMMDDITEVIGRMSLFANGHQLIFIVLGGLVLLSTSGYFVMFIFKMYGLKPPSADNLPSTDKTAGTENSPPPEKASQSGQPGATDEDRRYGKVFGKCENLIIYTLILLGGYTALALIFTGKTIVRSTDKEKMSVYHLAGTMINTGYSILIAFIIKFFIGKIIPFSSGS